MRRVMALLGSLYMAGCAGDFPPGQRPDIGGSWEPLAPQGDLYPNQDNGGQQPWDAGDGPGIVRDTRVPSGCKSDEQPFDGHCYRRASGLKMTFAEARTNCGTSSGKVVAIESKAEDDFIYGMLSSSTTATWIGLTRASGKWVWEGGAAPTYTNWAAGEPNNENNLEDCTVLWGPGLTFPEMRAKWNDVPCHDPGRDTVICERIP